MGLRNAADRRMKDHGIGVGQPVPRCTLDGQVQTAPDVDMEPWSHRDAGKNFPSFTTCPAQGGHR